MSDSWNTENEIMEIISELNEYVTQLENCLEIIRGLRDLNKVKNLRARVNEAKAMAKDWMK